MSSLEERLHRHARAFEQLLNLIPAKHYFSASDSNVQWNKRKQTKEESQRAKKAKLDPDLVLSAADFGRKRLEKIAGGCEGEGKGDEGGNVFEEPMAKNQGRLKQKKGLVGGLKVAGLEEGKGVKSNYKPTGECEEVEDDDGEAEEIQLNGFNFSAQLSQSPSPPLQSGPSSLKLKSSSEVSPEQRLEQKARLEARIQQLRAKRNADSPDGTPARNRNELMAARRREEAQTRKERKKEIRLKQKTTVEQTRGVALSPKKNPPKKDSQLCEGKGQQSVQCNTSINLPTHNRDKGKGSVVKKTNYKKSRPGFEGSLKASKKGGK